MSKLTSPLDHLRIAAPCSANWDQMFSFEDKRVRFCSQCNLNVYNLSGMSRNEAETLITKTEGRLCVRFYRRADGSILTQNCPVGLKVIKRRVVWLGQVFHGMVLSLLFILGLHNLSLAKKLLDAKRALPIDSHPEPIEMVGVVLLPLIEKKPPSRLNARKFGFDTHSKIKTNPEKSRLSHP